MKYKGLSFLALTAAFLLVFIGMIQAAFSLTGFWFFAEFVITGLFMLIALAGMAMVIKRIGAGWALLAFVNALVLLNVFLLSLVSGLSASVLSPGVIAALVGLFVSVANVGMKRKKGKKKNGSRKNSAKASKVSKSFTPGKFIASATGTVYHTPKCDWAKKIQKKNAV